MSKKIILTPDEQWILWYGGYDLGNRGYSGIKEFDIDISKAKKAESKAYKQLCENDSLLRRYGYRERRFNSEAHHLLREKLNNNE